MHRVPVILPLLILVTGTSAEFALQPQGDGRTLLLEDGRPVLVYNHGDQLVEGAAPDRTRSCYVHPLYGPHGEILTDDFPADHLHHRRRLSSTAQSADLLRHGFNLHIL